MIIDKEIRDKVTVLLEEVSRQFILPFYKNLKPEQIETKASLDDFVTIADKNSEFFLTKALIKLIEHSKVIGEESFAGCKNYPLSLEKEFVWTVDPIDGTKNFVCGNDNFCSMIVLLYYGKVVASWIYIPKSAICYFSDQYGVQVKHSSGMYEPLKMSKAHMLRMHISDLRFSASLKYLSSASKRKLKKNLDTFKKRVFIGSVGIEATLIANAEIDFIFYSSTSLWDHAPVDMLNRACGGKTRQIKLTDKSSSVLELFKRSPILFVRNEEMWDEVSYFILK